MTTEQNYNFLTVNNMKPKNRYELREIDNTIL